MIDSLAIVLLALMDYGSEIWGSSYLKKYNYRGLRFFKTVLGVRPQAPSVVVLGELGR